MNPRQRQPRQTDGLAARVAAYARRERFFAPGDTVLVAVSGGPDSVALLHLLHRLRRDLGIRLAAAHFDHGLRGQDSRGDVRFVQALADSLELPCHVGQGEVRVAARERQISLQMAARRLRHAFLRETCRTHGYAKAALGHTADDQVEVFFLRLLRGAGPQGLKGMWPATPKGLVRPLLAVWKREILEWLHEEALPFREDASNRDRRYLRNRVRLDLLPELTSRFNPQLPAAVWRLMDLLQEDERLLASQTRKSLASLVRQVTPDFFTLDLPGVFNLPPALQSRVLKELGERFSEDEGLTQAHVKSLWDLARARHSGGVIPVGAGLVSRAGPSLHFWRPLPEPVAAAVLLQPPQAGQAELPPGWRFTWRSQGAKLLPLPDAGAIIRMDREKTSVPLGARYLRPGDRCRLPGAPGAKKLQDILVDRKIPRWLRPHLPLVESEGVIVWVAGLGLTHGFAATPACGSFLEISIEPVSPQTLRLWDTLRAWQEGRG